MNQVSKKWEDVSHHRCKGMRSSASSQCNILRRKIMTSEKYDRKQQWCETTHAGEKIKAQTFEFLYFRNN